MARRPGLRVHAGAEGGLSHAARSLLLFCGSSVPCEAVATQMLCKAYSVLNHVTGLLLSHRVLTGHK